jgi:TPR repeat protein
MSVDYRAAYERFVAAADGGNDGYALYNLGVMYLKGWHVARNSVQALRYFRRALERGVGAAANAIGVLTARGDTFPADYQNAARWFEKGANMSDPDSIYNLGSLYLHGELGTSAAVGA